MRRFNYLVVAALLLTALVMSAAAEEEKAVVVPIASDGIQRVEMLGGEYFFKPKHIIVKVNVPVEIILKKESGIVPHNIVLKAPEAGIDISESLGTEPKTVRFTPTKKGKYEFTCDKKLLFFKSHKDRGMEGILEVVE
jgi:plastocyanin domain-containing protein